MSNELAVAKTDISLILNNINQVVDSECREIIIASEQSKIKDIEKKEVVMQMKDILVRTIFEAGHKFEEADQTALLMIVCDDLLRDFPYLTIDELRIAYRKGVRKDYGEYYGITVISLYGWVKKYLAESREEAMRIKREATLLANAKKYDTPAPSKEEFRKTMYNSSLELFAKYKENKESAMDIGNIHYNYLTGLGIIELTDERREKVIKMAEIKLRADNKPTLERGNTARMESKLLLKGLANKEPSAIKTLEIEARRIYLFECFNDLINMNLELKYVIDDKLKQNETK